MSTPDWLKYSVVEIPDKPPTPPPKPVKVPPLWQPQLDSLQQKLVLIRDRVKGVVMGWATGFYLWGNGGTSKTYSVEQALRELNKPYKLTNSRLTGKGLFELLQNHRDAIHVLDDVETLLGDKLSHGVLRSALWGSPNRHGDIERPVTWQIGGKRLEVLFTGGIILIANMPLEQIPTLSALASRIAVLRHEPSTEELIALMRDLAEQGFKYRGFALSVKECHEVVDEILYLSGYLERALDLRVYVQGRLDRLQWESGQADTHWLDLLESRLKQRSLVPKQRKQIEEEE